MLVTFCDVKNRSLLMQAPVFLQCKKFRVKRNRELSGPLRQALEGVITKLRTGVIQRHNATIQTGHPLRTYLDTMFAIGAAWLNIISKHHLLHLRRKLMSLYHDFGSLCQSFFQTMPENFCAKQHCTLRCRRKIQAVSQPKKGLKLLPVFYLPV